MEFLASKLPVILVITHIKLTISLLIPGPIGSTNTDRGPMTGIKVRLNIGSRVTFPVRGLPDFGDREVGGLWRRIWKLSELITVEHTSVRVSLLYFNLFRFIFLLHKYVQNSSPSIHYNQIGHFGHRYSRRGRLLHPIPISLLCPRRVKRSPQSFLGLWFHHSTPTQYKRCKPQHEKTGFRIPRPIREKRTLTHMYESRNINSKENITNIYSRPPNNNPPGRKMAPRSTAIHTHQRPK